MTQDPQLGELAEIWSDAPAEAPRRPTDRRRRHVAGIVAASIVAGLAIGCAAYVGWALTAPLPAPSVTAAVPQAPALEALAISQPQTAGSAVIVSGATDHLGAASGTRFGENAPDAVYPIASITKLITALVILDAHPLGSGDGPTITYSKTDHDLYDQYYVQGATVAAMPTGSSQSLRDALAAMLVPSAANYAEALTRWAFGSDAAFRDAARAWLDAHGMSHTAVVEPTGMSADNVSTASDMLLLGQLAAADPVISEITARPRTQLADGTAAFTTNALLGTDGVTGLKSGNIGPGTYALLYTATLQTRLREPLSVVGVMLGGSSREHVNESVVATLDSIAANARVVDIAPAGTPVGEITTPWGSTAHVALASDATIVAWGAAEVTATLDMGTPQKYADGEVVGMITWSTGPETENADVVISGAIVPPTAVWRLTHPGELAGVVSPTE